MGHGQIPLQTVRFCEFLSGFVKIIHMGFSLLKLLMYWQTILVNIMIMLKFVHFKKPVLSKSVVIFVIFILKMTTLFEINEDRITGFLK